jgi:hypothetical protein
VWFDGVDTTGPITLPNTNGADVWQTYLLEGLNFSAGNHIVRVETVLVAETLIREGDEVAVVGVKVNAGSGKISSSPRAIPASRPIAVSAGFVFGIWSALTMSVSIGPGRAARMSMRFAFSSGRRAWVAVERGGYPHVVARIC